MESFFLRQITCLEMLLHALRSLYFRTGDPAQAAALRQRMNAVTELIETRESILRCIRSTSWPASPSKAALDRLSRLEKRLNQFTIGQHKNSEALAAIEKAAYQIAQTRISMS
jgi:hypothetical protein